VLYPSSVVHILLTDHCKNLSRRFYLMSALIPQPSPPTTSFPWCTAVEHQPVCSGWSYVQLMLFHPYIDTFPIRKPTMLSYDGSRVLLLPMLSDAQVLLSQLNLVAFWQSFHRVWEPPAFLLFQLLFEFCSFVISQFVSHNSLQERADSLFWIRLRFWTSLLLRRTAPVALL